MNRSAAMLNFFDSTKSKITASVRHLLITHPLFKTRSLFLKISLKHIVLFFLTLVLSSVISAQEYQITVNNFSTGDGLSNRKVNSVCQDTFGFIWIATENGVNRYDGHSFVQYFANGSGLRKKYITEIYADTEGRIWCIHHKKHRNIVITNKDFANQLLVDVFDPQTESFQPLDSLTSLVEEREITSFHKAIDGELYFSTIDGRIFNTADLSKPMVSIGEDRPFYQFIFRENGIWTLGHQLFSHYSFTGELQKEEKINFNALCLAYRDKHSFWILPLISNPKYYPSWHLYIKQDNQAIALYGFSLQDKPVYRWVEQRTVLGLKNGLEVHVHQGTLYLYDPDRKQLLKELILDVSFIDYLPFITHLFRDRTGMIWASSSFGIFNISISTKKFKTILAGKSTRSIFQLNKDSLMIFTYDGTFINDLGENRVEKSKDPALKKNYLVGSAANDQGHFIAGGHSPDLLDIINTDGKVIDKFVFPFRDNKIHANILLPYRDTLNNKLWLISNNGLFELDELERERKPFLDYKGEEVFGGRYINRLFIDSSGMWVMMVDGLYLVNKKKEAREFFWNNKSVGVQYMYKDTDGIRWLSIFENGILRWDTSTDEMIHLNANNGLSNNNVYAIYEDDYDYLWLPSDYGLMRMNKKDFSIQIFLVEDGIAHNEFNHTSQFVSKEGLFYFGGLNGVTCFDPADFVAESKDGDLPRVTSLKFIRKGDEVLEDRTALFRKEKGITLNADDQSFVLSMTITDYRNPKKQSFAYQIEGLDNQWTEIKENFIRVNRLPYGNYKLLLKARHLGGQWSDQVLKLPLYIERPVYLEPWFLGLLMLAVLGLTGLTIHWRLRWLEKDKERLEEEVELRTQTIAEQKTELEALNKSKDQFFGIIAHDLRGPVISFRGLSKKIAFLIRRKETERLNELGESIDNAASNLEKLLDNLLNWALVQNGRLPFHPEGVFLQPIIDETLMIFQGVFESKLITIKTEVETDLQIYADVNGLSAIIRNLLSNAIKYSKEGGHILVLAKRNKDHILIRFDDNGVGMSNELIQKILNKGTQHVSSMKGTGGEKGTGLGLQLCKELIDLHKGTVDIYNNNPGLAVCVQLPIYEL